MIKSTTASLAKIKRSDLTITDDTDYIIKELCTEIMNLKQIAQIRKEIYQQLEEENAELRARLYFGEDE